MAAVIILGACTILGATLSFWFVGAFNNNNAKGTNCIANGSQYSADLSSGNGGCDAYTSTGFDQSPTTANTTTPTIPAPNGPASPTLSSPPALSFTTSQCNGTCLTGATVTSGSWTGKPTGYTYTLYVENKYASNPTFDAYCSSVSCTNQNPTTATSYQWTPPNGDNLGCGESPNDDHTAPILIYAVVTATNSAGTSSFTTNTQEVLPSACPK